MNLPYAEKAIVNIRKVRDYCLSATHPRGKHKARVFQSVLGMTVEDSDEFADSLRQAALNFDAIQGVSDQFGDRYIVDFPLERNDKRATIRSSWIVLNGEQAPRFVTCFLL